MSANPYQAPAAVVADVDESNAELNMAGKGRRFANYLIDYILFQLLCGIGGGVLGFLQLGAWLTNMNRFGAFLLGYVIYLAYYLFFEGIWARTPAKFITRTCVVTVDGEVPTFMDIFKRSCARLIPFEPFSFFGGMERGGWHDSLTDTRVVLTAGR